MMVDCPSRFSDRLARLRAVMAEGGADIFLCDQAELMAWTGGYMNSETMYRAILVPAGGDPWVVLRRLDEAPCRTHGWIDDIEGYADTDDPVECVAESLGRRGFADARIGFDPSSYAMTASRRERLGRLLPRAEWVPFGGLSDRIRWVKDAHEIETLRRAADIADRTMAEVHRSARVGMTTREVAAIAASSYRRLGADDGQVGRIARGRGGTGFLHAELDDEPLAPGDILHVELVPRVAHYSARLMRPIHVGPPSADVRQTADEIVRLQDRQIAALRAGTAAAEADAVLRRAMIESGLRPDYDNVSAYGLGLYGRTPRSSDFSCALLPTADWELKAGMAFHCYTSARGLAFSESVVVGEAGGDRLTCSPRELLVCAAES